MCVLLSELYKEYRSLKQAKENTSTGGATEHSEQPTSISKNSTAPKVINAQNLIIPHLLYKLLCQLFC